MRYNLHDQVPRGEMLVYGFQYVIYFLAGSAIMPVMIAAYLGLSHAEATEMLQRTFILCGVISIVQARWGHGFPIIDGPSGLWMGILVTLSGAVTGFGGDLTVMRAELEAGMLIAGGLVILLAAFGFVPMLVRLFTPMVNGVFLMLVVLQLSGTFMKGMAGVVQGAETIDSKTAFVFFFTVAVIVLINLKTRGFIQSIATLVGVAAGWILAYILGVSQGIGSVGKGMIYIPQLFAWGTPSLNPGIAATCVFGCLVLLSNVIVTVNGFSDITGNPLKPSQMKRGIAVYGISSALMGILPTAGHVTFASSLGVVAMTGVAAKKPFYIGSFFMILLGFILPVGAFFASIPPSVGYAAMMVIFALIFGTGLSEIQKTDPGTRENLIVGTALIVGTGIMFLPVQVFSQMPQLLQYVLSNGLIDGVILTMLLEKLIPAIQNVK